MSIAPRNEYKKLAQLQAEQARAKRQKTLLAITSTVVVIVIVSVVVLWIVASTNSKNNNKKVVAATSNSSYISSMIGIPQSMYDAVGVGKANILPTKVSGQPALTMNDKPEVLYIGAEYCPYCAMYRWSLTAALSRFGSFTGLQTQVSTTNDTVQNVPTATYVNVNYTSKYISFVHYETQDRNGNPLQKPSNEANTLFTKIDSQGSIPFVDFGNVAASIGAVYNGDNYMQNVSGTSVATQLADAESQQSQGIIGGANIITAQICRLTKGQPGSVCNSGGVMAAATKLP